MIIENTDKVRRLTFEGAMLTDIIAVIQKMILYKVCYIYDLTYEEALSLLRSNTPKQMYSIMKYQLTKEELSRK